MSVAHTLCFYLALMATSAAPPVNAPDRVIGLLTLPEVFGNGPCDRFAPREVPLFARPGAREAVAYIRTDRHWSFPAEGGCEGLTVRVHWRRGGPAADLPTAEFAYESPAAIVLEQRGDWFRLRLAEGSAWARPAAHGEYLPLARLFEDRAAHFTESWDGRIWKTPGSAPRKQAWRSHDVGVRVLGSRSRAGELWFLIELPAPDACGETAKHVRPVRGWIRAHGTDGRPAIWFASRGC